MTVSGQRDLSCRRGFRVGEAGVGGAGLGEAGEAQGQHHDGGTDAGEHCLQRLELDKRDFPRLETDQGRTGRNGNRACGPVPAQGQHAGCQESAAAARGQEKTGHPPVRERGALQHVRIRVQESTVGTKGQQDPAAEG